MIAVWERSRTRDAVLVCVLVIELDALFYERYAIYKLLGILPEHGHDPGGPGV